MYLCIDINHNYHMKKRHIAVFDFDGTLTTKDTLVEFIRFAFGTRRMLGGFLRYAPLIVLMKLHLYDNSRCKEHVLSWFFRGMPYSEFEELGMRFAAQADSLLRRDTVALLQRHLAAGDTLYIISASAEEWVRPVCEQFGMRSVAMPNGIAKVMGTRLEVSDGKLTGRYASPNCYGKEKVNRLKEVEPNRNDYHLTAYGDSRGDKEMFAFADTYHKV